MISILKGQINQNNKEIQSIQLEIDHLLSDTSSGVKKAEVDSKYAINQQLQKENSDFRKMQEELSGFLEKYSYFFNENTIQTPPAFRNGSDVQTLLIQTANGIIPFDSSHPHFNDSEFFNKLLNYCQTSENYEMCDKLLKIRKN